MRIIDNIFTDFNYYTLDFTLINLILLLFYVKLILKNFIIMLYHSE